MNDIENAIEYIETNYKNIGIDYSNGKDHTAITLVDKQAELAIEILKEKLEREKGCEHCRNAVEIGAVDSDGTMRVDKGNEHCLPFIAVDNDTYGTSNLFDVNYCPHCGRKLGENNG